MADDGPVTGCRLDVPPAASANHRAGFEPEAPCPSWEFFSLREGGPSARASCDNSAARCRCCNITDVVPSLMPSLNPGKDPSERRGMHVS